MRLKAKMKFALESSVGNGTAGRPKETKKLIQEMVSGLTK